MIFTKLILAHLVGDFLLQPNTWVGHKERHKAASPYLYLHTLVHFLLILLFLWDLNLWWIAIIVAVSHLIIDWAKLNFHNPKTKKIWFFIDQALHITVIASLAGMLNEINFELIKSEKVLRFVAGFLFVTIPSSIIIKTLISSWMPFSQDKNSLQTESLVNAGKYIGILERMMVFIFIFVNHWEGVGFMVAAKSVFRFSDLAESKQRKLTEYVLIGTLLSFSMAIFTAIIAKL